MGGYKLIDLKGHNFTAQSSSTTIPGIYDSIESCRKATLVTGFVYDNIERMDRYAVFGVSGQNYVATLAISADVDVLQCTVTPDDLVTISNY